MKYLLIYKIKIKFVYSKEFNIEYYCNILVCDSSFNNTIKINQAIYKTL